MNCLIVDDNQIIRILLTEMLSEIDFVNVVGACENPIQALKLLNTTNVDLILLDVEMPKMTGIEFLKSTTKRPLVILVTARVEYALEAFEYNVVDYVVKPIQLERLMKALIKANDLFESSNHIIEKIDTNYVFVRENGVLQKIFITEILFIKALGDYIIVYVGDNTHTLHLTLKSFLEKFNLVNFMRIHRSYIVAIDKIDKVEDGTIFIKKHSIPIGDIYRPEFLKKINII